MMKLARETYLVTGNSVEKLNKKFFPPKLAHCFFITTNYHSIAITYITIPLLKFGVYSYHLLATLQHHQNRNWMKNSMMVVFVFT